MTAEYEYDWLNRQTSAEADGEVISEYNGEGLRVEKQAGESASRYLYEYSKVVLELDGEGEVSAKNTYGLNLISREIDSDKYYYLYNGNADVTGLVTVTGEVYGTYYYDAFGNIIDETGEADNPFRYKGYQYDDETGLYYLNSRMYDPVTARFLQEDTYSGNSNDPLSLNLYTYCHNEPIMYWDPTGHNDIENVERLLNDIIRYKETWVMAEKEKVDEQWFIRIPLVAFPTVNPSRVAINIIQISAHISANEAREEIKQSDLYKNNPVFQAEYDNYLKEDWGGTFEDVKYLIELLESPQLIPTPTSTPISTVTQGTGNAGGLVTLQNLDDFGFYMGSTPSKRQANTEELNRVLRKYNINKPLRIAFFLGNVAKESWFGSRTLEKFNGSSPETYFNNKYSNNSDLGNQGGNDGELFRGAGYIQMTGRNNYQEFANYIKDQSIMKDGYRLIGGVYNKPVSQIKSGDLGVIDIGKYAWESAGWFWVYGNAIGKNLNTLADNKDYNGVLNGINSKDKGSLQERNSNINKIYKILTGSELGLPT